MNLRQTRGWFLIKSRLSHCVNPSLWILVGAAAASTLSPTIGESPQRLAAEESARSTMRRSSEVDVIEACREAVVGIEVAVSDAHDSEWLESGSGVLINARGYLLSNYHVVRHARTIRVRLADGRKLPGRIEAISEASDLVLIRLSGVGRSASKQGRTAPLHYVSLGYSDDLLPGETVLAIGTPYGLSHTVSRGVVSATQRAVRLPNGRQYDDFIQTDAAINPGNSGGGLFNLDGELVGINAAIFNHGWGIAFAIPVDRIKDLLTTYVSREHSTGLVVRSRENDGVLEVEAIAPGSPAEAAGFAIGDELVLGNGQPLRVGFDLVCASLGTSAAQPLRVFVRRGSDEIAIDVGAESLPWQRLGISVADIRVVSDRSRDTKGVMIRGLQPSGPAEQAGLQVGDVLTELTVGLSETPTVFRIESEAELRLVLERFGRDRVRIAFLRNGERRESFAIPRPLATR